MLLKNNVNTLWLMNLVSATFFVLLLFDVITSLTLLFLGTFAGFLAYTLAGSYLNIPPNSLSLSELIATLIPAVLIGCIFARNKQLIEEIRLRSIKAEESSRAKTEFIANMSHDIRTPLTGIINFSRYLKEEEGLSVEARKELAEDTYHASEQLLILLNGVLDVVSSDTAIDNEIKHKNFDLFLMLDDLIQLEKPAVKSHKLELRQYFDPKIPRYIVSDKTKLHRILLNLIGNAIKFTEKGYIELRAQIKSKTETQVTIVFAVKDTGIGIPKESQDQIFDRFYKVNPSYKGKYTGSGIGLHIVQKYTQLLGGEIKFHSQYGKGSTFFVTLTCPIGEAVEEEQHNAPNLKQVVDTSQSSVKILVIEDNLVALKSLKLLLLPYKLQVMEAKTAEEAFELVKEDWFDLIITDIGLPEMQGDELVEKIRHFEKAKARKRSLIVALSGHAVNQEMDEVYKRVGMDEIYQKPIVPAQLEKLLHPLIQKNQELKPIILDSSDTEKQLFDLDRYPLLDLNLGTNILGSEEIAKSILADLRKDGIEPDLGNLTNAYAKGDWETISALAHKMKGGASLGTIRLYHAFLNMERYKQARPNHCAEVLYAQMLQVIDETLEYLDENL